MTSHSPPLGGVRGGSSLITMLQNVTSVEMPIDEQFRIRKNHFRGGKGRKRFCVVTGTHGDELEGQYVVFKLAEMLRQHPEKLNGVVDLYPALNPLGIDSIQRGVPAFDLDMNRIFPGDPHGSMVEKVAHDIYTDLRGADMVIDIHSSNMFLRELPQVRISEQTAETLVPYAKMLNIDLIWVHQAATVLESTLAHSLNVVGTPVLVAEMGIGMRINRKLCNQLLHGILNLMHHMGIWADEVDPSLINEPIISEGDSVDFLNAATSGIFVPEAHNDRTAIVEPGQLIGQIISPLKGEVLQEVRAPHRGILFTIRAYPIIYEGSLLARIHKL